MKFSGGKVLVRSLYAKPAVVAKYATAKGLYAPEAAILEELKDWLTDKEMLDVGVGGGRTTLHFGPAVRRYVGIDASAEMIHACDDRLKARSPAEIREQSLEFSVCDARSMMMFKNDSFDFILFSYNGIDDVSDVDRLRVLHELHRVIRPTGYFCFSSHNLQHMDKRRLRFRRNLPKNPARLFRKRQIQKLLAWVRLRFYNRHLYRADMRTLQSATIYDHNHGALVKTYYITPRAQVAQLRGLFSDTMVFSLKSGKALESSELDSARDPWLYYLCRAV